MVNPETLDKSFDVEFFMFRKGSLLSQHYG